MSDVQTSKSGQKFIFTTNVENSSSNTAIYEIYSKSALPAVPAVPDPNNKLLQRVIAMKAEQAVASYKRY